MIYFAAWLTLKCLGFILDYFAVITFYPLSLAAALFFFFDLHNIANTICVMSDQSHSRTQHIWKYTQLYLPWGPLPSQPQLNVKWHTLAPTVKRNGNTDAVKILLYVFLFLGGLVLMVKPWTLEPDSSGRGPSWTPTRELCLLSLWAFLSSALWRASGNMTCKDFLWKGEPASLSSLASPGPTRLLKAWTCSGREQTERTQGRGLRAEAILVL